MKWYWLLNGQAVAHCVEARCHKPEGRGLGGMKTHAIGRRIILTWIFRKWGVFELWTGSRWLRIRTGGRHL
jgi:hypothetical protein